MSISKKPTLVQIPAPGMGHLVPALELAKQLVAREPSLAITVIIIKFPIPDEKFESLLQSLKSDQSLVDQGIQFVDMPLPLDESNSNLISFSPRYFSLYIESYKSKIKIVLDELRIEGPVAGILIDMFCTAMIEVADELGLPSFGFFTSGANLQGLGIDVFEKYDIDENPDEALEIPGFKNPVPVKVWPGVFLNKDGDSTDFLRHAERYRKTKGILVNTFNELEFNLINAISKDSGLPPIYPVGPILNLNPPLVDGSSEILRWLDLQPPESVVFLCFGSMGSFDEEQIKEIAVGLEQSGKRFLWSLRQDQSALPEGFLERTREKGRVIGWAPQVKVLAHKSIGVFVSHCGWNSTLESLWYGVPIAAWPIYAEQQLNAFVLVRELGIATEVRMDYRRDSRKKMVVLAAEVEDGIKKAMENEEVKKKVKEMSDMARKALEEGGSSYESLGNFIKSVFHNLPSSQ